MISPLYPGVDTRSVVDELRGRIVEELDYAREADNQRTFHELYDDHPFIRIPRVYASHSTARVLTTEFVDGRRFAEVLDDRRGDARALRRDPVPLRVRIDHPPRHVQRRSAPRQLPVRRRRPRRLPRLRLREVFPAGDAAQLAGAGHSAPGRRSRRASRAQLVALDFIPSTDGLDRDVLFDYFGYFYEPIQEDREFAFTREYNAESLQAGVQAATGSAAALVEEAQHAARLRLREPHPVGRALGAGAPRRARQLPPHPARAALRRSAVDGAGPRSTPTGARATSRSSAPPCRRGCPGRADAACAARW